MIRYLCSLQKCNNDDSREKSVSVGSVSSAKPHLAMGDEKNSESLPLVVLVAPQVKPSRLECPLGPATGPR